jgi:hypothetical protein
MPTCGHVSNRVCIYSDARNPRESRCLLRRAVNLGRPRPRPRALPKPLPAASAAEHDRRNAAGTSR